MTVYNINAPGGAGTDGKATTLSWGGGGLATDTSVRYTGAWVGNGVVGTTETGQEHLIIAAGILANAYVDLSLTPNGTVTFTIRKNGVDTTLVVSTNTTAGSNTTDSLTVAPGDILTLKVQNSVGELTSNAHTFGVGFTPT